MPLPPSEAYPEWRERGRRDSAGEESAVGLISKIASSDAACITSVVRGLDRENSMMILESDMCPFLGFVHPKGTIWGA